MKFRCLPLTAALALSVASLATTAAETRVPAPAANASAPIAVKPGPRLVSPVEMNQNASPPGELRPENPVTPQIVIPLRNQSAVQPQPEKRKPKAAKPAPTGGVNDAAARCEALSDAAARAACRDKVPPETSPR